jgi:hypothetical protein
LQVRLFKRVADGDCRETLDTIEDLGVDVNDGATLLLDSNDILAAPDEVALDPSDNEFSEFEQAPPTLI